LVALAGAVAVLVLGGCGGGSQQHQRVDIRYSLFEQREITVPAGQLVTFTLRNEDPIEHEWLVGDDAFHERHRTGTEAFHDTRPDEVTLPPFGTRETVLMFPEPGEYRYICHLPGHEAYGMVGVLRVVEG
jgi:uncharacterized cupredoxin-like copper-binding protein